jgi:hypothetical protein
MFGSGSLVWSLEGRAVHVQWETALRKAVQELPHVRFGEPGLEP